MSAANKLSVYLNVNGAKEAEAKLKRLGKYGTVSLNSITTSAKPVNSSLIALNETVGTVGKTMRGFMGLAGAYLGFQGASASVEAVKATNVEFQKLSASLKVTEGSAEKAKEVLSKLDNLAKQTPYSVQSLTEAWVKLGNLGLKPSEAALLSYGNTSSAMGKDIMQFIEAIADASTMEFERLKEFGIKAKQQNEEVSFTFQGTTTTVKKNAESIKKYLTDIGNIQFAGAMTEQMDTIGGAISNRDDQLASFQRRIGNNGFNASLQEFYTESGNVIAQSVDLADGIGSALGAITQGATTVVKNLDILRDAIIAFSGFKALQLGASATTTAIASTTLASRNMALSLSASSVIAGKAATAQVAAMSAMSFAAKGLTAAMGLVGGPLGIIAIAGFSIYQFAKKSDAAADASNKYASELKEVEKNAKSLTTATNQLNDATSKQTKLALLNDIDEAKKSIADIKDQIANTQYTDESIWTRIFSSETVEGEIIKLKTELNEGTLTLEKFKNKLTAMGENDIKFRKPALKLTDLTNSIISEMIRMQVQQSITGPLSSALSSALGNMFAGGSGSGVQNPSTIPTPTYNVPVRHTGGSIDGSSLTRSVSLYDIPKYHSGSSILQDEQIALVQKKEIIFSRNESNQVRSMLKGSNRGQSPIININVENHGNSKVKTKASEDTNGFNLDIIVEEIEGTMAKSANVINWRL